MLSFKEGRPIAIIKGGKYNNEMLHITDNNEKNMIKNSPLEMLEDIYKGKNTKKLSRTEMSAIKNALITGDEKYAESLYDIISDVKSKSKELSKKEFKIYDDGIIQPLPRFNKTERCYIAGQTECGKTYWCKRYLQQLRKVYPEKKIFVFSDVSHDPELDCIKNLVRFELDEELIDKKPIKPEVFKNSICVFDDIDSIQNKQLYKIIQNLRDSLLRRGRHEDISTLITSHLLTNYKDTRIILNECNSITIFCRSGSTYGIKYLLKKYIGLDKKGIQKVLNLPSRWVTIYKNHPQYVLYEKGVYIL
jgi:hypothetical protein